MDEITPLELDCNDRSGVDAARHLIVSVFDNARRYPETRIAEELRPALPPSCRQFLVVRDGERLIGIGGIKTADWASDTHILYLSAVAPDYRGKGIGRALVQARVAWIRERHARGCILVSTAKPKRYRDFGFRDAERKGGRKTKLMLLEF